MTANRAAQEVGRLGGLAKSEAKAAANRAKALAFWEDVRAGKAQAPRRRKARAKRSPNATLHIPTEAQRKEVR